MRSIAKVFAIGIALAGLALPSVVRAETQTAIFAGGCFWCVEADFDYVSGVISTTSGYTGGRTQNPTYKNHGAGGHREAVRIVFDSNRVTYAQLTDIFFRSVNPTDGGGQFCDRGHSYTTAIYTLDGEQAKVARAAKSKAAKALGKNIVTPIKRASAFWPAEDYHQNYYKKNPFRYDYYRKGCRRDAALRQLWGKEALKGIAAH